MVDHPFRIGLIQNKNSNMPPLSNIDPPKCMIGSIGNKEVLCAITKPESQNLFKSTIIFKKLYLSFLLFFSSG